MREVEGGNGILGIDDIAIFGEWMGDGEKLDSDEFFAIESEFFADEQEGVEKHGGLF